jgi:hypothetical protein
MLINMFSYTIYIVIGGLFQELAYIENSWYSSIENKKQS